MSSPILLCPEGCDGCGKDFALLARTVLGLLCPECYDRKGRPMGAAIGVQHELEEETRKSSKRKPGRGCRLEVPPTRTSLRRA